jgi:predicted membrane-bound mannosyltransferase
MRRGAATIARVAFGGTGAVAAVRRMRDRVSMRDPVPNTTHREITAANKRRPPPWSLRTVASTAVRIPEPAGADERRVFRYSLAIVSVKAVSLKKL